MMLSRVWMHLSFRCSMGEVWSIVCKLVEFKVVMPEKVIIDRVEKEKTSHYEPQGLRWSELKPQKERKALNTLIDVEKSYNFRPYSYTMCGVTPNLSNAQTRGEVLLVPRANIPLDTYFVL